MVQKMLLSLHFSVRFHIFRNRNLVTSRNMPYEWLPCLETRLNEAHGPIHFGRREILSAIPLFMSMPLLFLDSIFLLGYPKIVKFDLDLIY